MGDRNPDHPNCKCTVSYIKERTNGYKFSIQLHKFYLFYILFIHVRNRDVQKEPVFIFNRVEDRHILLWTGDAPPPPPLHWNQILLIVPPTKFCLDILINFEFTQYKLVLLSVAHCQLV